MKRRLQRDGAERMIVVVRVRVLTERERQLCSLRYPHRASVSYCCVDCVGEDVIVTDPDSPEGSCSRRYTFDRVFDSTSTNDDVYAATVKPLLPGLLEGYNATCFAYGMTGAGKTFTMMGTDRFKGLCTMAVEELFPKIESMTGKCAVHASYLEIYNEKIKDLLSRNDARRHDIIEDPERGVVVTDLAEYLVTNLQDLHTLMSLGCEKRTRASTSSNVVSSRSHAILLITVKHQSNDKMASIGKLALIDLAGSERACPGETRQSKRVQEGANINRSLLALGNCITILGDGKERRHVPYRDSKLTRLLKDSLGGNTRTVMIGNTSPSSTCYEELVSTLKYASRARNISRHVTRNAVAVSPETPKQNEHLLTDVRQLQDQLSSRSPPLEVIERPIISKPFIAIPIDDCVSTHCIDDQALLPIKKAISSCFYLKSSFDATLPTISESSIADCNVDNHHTTDPFTISHYSSADLTSDDIDVNKVSMLSSDEWSLIENLINQNKPKDTISKPSEQHEEEEGVSVSLISEIQPEFNKRLDDQSQFDLVHLVNDKHLPVDDIDCDETTVGVHKNEEKVIEEVQQHNNNSILEKGNSILMEEIVSKKSTKSRPPRERRTAVDHSAVTGTTSSKWRETRVPDWRTKRSDLRVVESIASLVSPHKSGIPSSAPSPTLPCSSTKSSELNNREALVLFP